MIGSKLGIYSQQNQATEPLLLDTYPATAAYSLRKLRAAYTGAAIGVRIDTTGQPTYNIGFDSNGNLDTADLLSKAGANDAYVTTWYDQSGNGNNATNLEASAQPRIVNAGSLETNNGVAAIYFDGSGDTLTFDNINTYAAFIVENVTIIGGFGLLGSTANSNIIGDLNSSNGRIRLNNTNYDFAVSNPDNALTVLNRSSNDYSYFVNSNASTNNPRTIAFDMNLNAMMNRQATFFYEGYLNEIIIYNSDQSANILAIENNINTYYQIYWDGSQTGLLDDYSGASAAYSVRALNSAYTGPLVKVRRSSDNNEQDIYAKYNGDLDRDSLLSFVGANDGFVSTWYDQSGNANNATNLTAANQPQIVSSGTIVLKNSLPTISYNSSTKRLSTALVVGASSVFATHSVNSQIGANYILGSSSPVNNGLIAQGTAVNGLTAFSSPNVFELGNTEDTNLNLATLIQNSNTNLSINGNALTSSTFVGNIFLSDLGNRTGANVAIVGNISECIVYSTDQTANKTEIETNINNYFTIYP